MPRFKPHLEATPDWTVVADGDDDCIEFRLGFVENASQIALMCVALQPLSDEGHRFIFGIRIEQLRTAELSEYIFLHKVAKKFLEGLDKDVVLALVFQAIPILLNSTKPSVILMETAEPALKPKVMKKYSQIIEIFKLHGYDLVVSHRFDDNIDRWIFEHASLKQADEQEPI